jgi:hypothetical protein
LLLLFLRAVNERDHHDYTTYIYTDLPLLFEFILMVMLTVPFTYIPDGCASKRMWAEEEE